jgi:hypothetical protein
MKSLFKLCLYLFIIFLLILGFTNPDTTTHNYAISQFLRSRLNTNSLYNELKPELRPIVEEHLINAEISAINELKGRKNYILFSKIENYTIGAINNVWIIKDENYDPTDDIVFTISQIINEQSSDSKNNLYLSSLIINKFNNSTNYGLVTGLIGAGYFHRSRSRNNYILNNCSLALKDLEILKKNNLLTSYDYYTYYLIYNSSFCTYYDPNKANYYMKLSNKTNT